MANDLDLALDLAGASQIIVDFWCHHDACVLHGAYLFLSAHHYGHYAHHFLLVRTSWFSLGIHTGWQESV